MKLEIAVRIGSDGLVCIGQVPILADRGEFRGSVIGSFNVNTTPRRFSVPLNDNYNLKYNLFACIDYFLYFLSTRQAKAKVSKISIKQST
jgi:hypothetical protein